MKTLYNSLKPEYRKTLQDNMLWSRLTVSEVRDVITFTDNKIFEMSYEDWAFGDKFLQDE